jgi:hypothetical protein
MGAGRAYGEEGIGASSHQYGLALGVALQQAALAKLSDGDPPREVRPAQFLFFSHFLEPPATYIAPPLVTLVVSLWCWFVWTRSTQWLPARIPGHASRQYRTSGAEHFVAWIV